MARRVVLVYPLLAPHAFGGIVPLLAGIPAGEQIELDVRTDPAIVGLVADSERSTAADESVGFRIGDKGTHTSRTIMLGELETLLRAAKSGATRNEYRTLIVDDNCLGKRTAATRRSTDQRLSELYALDANVLLFRVMRRFWQADDHGHPLLALLLALARDPLLRLTAPPLIRLRPGEELGRQALTDALHRGTRARFNDAVLDKIVRNAAASWTQSGHLKGRSRKIRQRILPTPPTTAYALLLGHLSGTRGAALFESLWAQVLDAPVGELMHLATDAKRLGFLDLSQSGGVIDVSFSRLLAQDERR